MGNFDYGRAFERNIGWVTEAEQARLRGKRVAIAGLGGVGGIHLLTLARLGIGAFNIADLDTFDLVNFNRQAGATMTSLERPKAQVLAEMARDINPEVELRVFDQGVSESNLDDFLRDVDIYVDGLDFFAFGARRATFAACARLGIPAVTAAPLGMGTAVLNFLPGRMSFEEYFRLEGRTEIEQGIRFLIGLSPALLQRGYLADPSRVDLAARKGPSTIMACQLCAGVAATEALKILLDRGSILAAPHGLHFDAYRNKMVKTWRPWGNNNPLQRLMITVAKWQLRGFDKLRGASAAGLAMAPSVASDARPIERILDLAHWAPSGDNTQPWRFEIVDDHHVVAHCFDTRDHVVYDLHGRPSQIAIGAMLETLRIGASGLGFAVELSRRHEAPETTPTFDIRITPSSDTQPSPLLPFVVERRVQRRAMRTRSLTGREREALQIALGPDYRVHWIEGFDQKLRAARLMFSNAKLRLTLPEAYPVHRDIMDWERAFSPDRVPVKAVGLDPVTSVLMRWAMKSWRRVEFLNTYLMGTLLPRIELDFVPGLACAAHFVIVARNPLSEIDDFVAGGGAVQRFWLTATRLGLQLQPEMTPLIFDRYHREGVQYSTVSACQAACARTAEQLEALVGVEVARHAVFMGRLGAGPAASARSVRLGVRQLLRG